MSLFSNMTTDGLEEAGDKLGGGYEPVPSDIYPAHIKLVYVGKAQSSNAQSITVHADINGKDFRETIWITTKDGNNFYIPKDQKNGKVTKHPLPGFTTVDDLCLLTTGSPLSEQPTEEKVVKLYDPAERKETNQTVQVLIDVMGKQALLGIVRNIVDKQKKGDDGKYHNTGETRTENSIDKVFHADTKRTVSEYRHDVQTAEFHDAWKARNAGKDRNRSKGLEGASGPGTSGIGRPGGAAPSASKKLFGS